MALEAHPQCPHRPAIIRPVLHPLAANSPWGAQRAAEELRSWRAPRELRTRASREPDIEADHSCFGKIMTAVFVHGVPETGRLWDPLRRHLKVDSLALNLPGFSTPRPAGFGATMDDYVRWLSGELRGISGPVDLVGHDWGALLVARVAMLDSLTLRSWAMDVASILHPEYVWHAQAQLWQTSGAGEQWAQTMRGNTTVVAAALTAAGVPAEDASGMGAQFDATMAGCILDLYRSATPNPYAHWGDLTRTAAPGLVIQPLSDPYDDQINSQKVAERLGAHVECLPAQSHWWMLSAPEEGAAALLRFWKAVGTDS